MQLLNSKILSDDKNTRYSNKKAQDTQYLVLFVCCNFFVQQRWRRERDSNPRYISVHLISSQGRYNHFDISPFCSDHCPNRNSIPHFSSDCKTFFEKSPAIRRIFCFLRRQVSPQTAPCASSARILPMNTPIADAIISPLVHPLESPRQCSPLTFVFSRSSIFTRLL